MNKKSIYKQSKEIELYDLTGMDLIGHIQDMIKDVGKDAHIEVNVKYDYDGCSEVFLSLGYYREETDEEYTQRIDQEKAQKKRLREAEKETYLRLKSKFESKE